MAAALNITLRHLRAALAVAQFQSFRRAAEELHISQPALSLTISELERNLGVVLFDRNSRMVRTTELGQAFLAQAGRLMGDLTRLVDWAGDIARSRRGKVVVGTLASVAARAMPQVIRQCAIRFPEIEVVIQDDVASRVAHAVRQGDADLGVAVRVADSADEMRFEPLCRDPLHVVFQHTHRFAQLQQVEWRDLAGESFVGLTGSSSIHSDVNHEIARQDIVFERTVSFSNLATVHGMLEAGIGISVLPVLALPYAGHTLLTHRPLVEPALSREIGILRRKDRSFSPAAEGFLEVLRELLGTAPSANDKQS